MRAMVVVAMTPVLGHSADFGEAGEDVTIEHFGAQAVIEAFDVCVLSRLAGLDMDEFDVLASCPIA